MSDIPITIIISASVILIAFVGLSVREHYLLKIAQIRAEYDGLLDAAFTTITDSQPRPQSVEVVEELTIPRAWEWPTEIDV